MAGLFGPGHPSPFVQKRCKDTSTKIRAFAVGGQGALDGRDKKEPGHDGRRSLDHWTECTPSRTRWCVTIALFGFQLVVQRREAHQSGRHSENQAIIP